MQAAGTVRVRRRNYYAAKHIREAEEFFAQLGGLDEVVKNYFFALSPTARKKVFDAYGAANGASAKSYAEFAWPLWKANKRKMSGTVAKRLFDCIPPLMPEAEKYDLARRIWDRYAPRTMLKLLIGPCAPIESVLAFVYGKLDAAVQDHFIPQALKNNFRWLAENDVLAYERLLNYFVHQEKALACQEVRSIVPLLQKQKREHPEMTQKTVKTVCAGGNTIELIIDGMPDSNVVREWVPTLYEKHGSSFWMWVIAGILLLMFLAGK